METKEKILKAVLELFSEKGYMLSMSDISKKVGIRVPSIYSHFECKDQIIYLVIKEELTSYNDYMESLLLRLKDKKTEDILSGIYFGILDYYSDLTRLKLSKNIDLIPESPLYDQCKELKKKHIKDQIDVLTILFEQGHKKGEIKWGVNEGYQYLYLTMIRGVLEGMITYSDQGEVRKIYEKKVWEIFWNSIKESGE